VHAFAREHGIPCDLEACNTVDIIYDEGDWAHACAAVEAMRAALPPGHPAAEYTLYSAEQARARFHVHDTHFGGKEEKVCGAVEYFAGSLSAYRFCVGVLRMCLDWGMNLQTGTPVVGLSRDVTATASTTDVVGGDGGDGVGAMWTVHTPRGAIRARRVVLATNGYTARIVPRFQGVLVPLRGQITAQRPGTAMPNGGCLPTTYSFCYKKGYEYMITRPQGSRFAGDVIIGGGLAREPDEGLLEFGTTDDTAVNERISRYLREATPRYFGSDWGDDDPAGRVRSEWTGIMGFSPDGFPFVGEVPGEKGLWASCGFQGHGMVLCWMCARALVEMMEGRDNEQLRDWFPDTYRITATRLAKKFEGRLH
jgi:glycine/D-amino acid oxidase-like deaminating enzyme